MHGGEGERRIHCFRHMLSVSVPATSSSYVAAAPPITSYSFSEDGRKICVGDCALFKPPQDSPPFIGIIRWLTLGKEENISLSVNWLYRPADIKIGKGILPEAAPNELFYSFHKDEIPAASLLHPCKVAFLCKGVELPFGISSFVCRRVYDIENKSLWWLTDNDYVNERQEEVNQLLDKTRQEMYGTLQSCGRSPKPSNGPSGTQQLRHGSESVQTSTSPLPFQVRGKRRDRGDQGSDTIKRVCISGTDDTESGQFRPEHILKSEIAKITDKGGLIDFKGVEKFVHLMQPDRTEKKINLACRIMLVDVIAVTDSFDCLGWFVQLKGLPVLDEWLQEIHKGKVGDGSSPKESDKSVEDFLLALLRALDKLPVNLHALQTSNVGKSVNHLRSHKNSEIQRKARSLVDLWKKRVEAEMNVIDTKSGLSRGGSWPSKSVLEEVSHAGNRRNEGPSEVSAKSSTAQSSACKASVKLGSGEAVAKIALELPGSTKSEASLISLGGATAKDPNSATTLVGGGTSDLSTIKEEKSSSSCQSQNNSQSWSSDHANARSSIAGSSVSKISGSASRHRKSSNGLQGSTVSGVQNETRSGKFTSSSRNLASEKASPTSGTSERLPDVPLVDHGNSQRLIVRLPSNCQSPGCSANGGSFDDPTATLIKASPLAHSENLDHHDRKVKGTNDALLASGASNVNLDLCQSRDGLVRSDEGNVYSPGAPCNEHIRAAEDGEKLSEMSKDTASSVGVTTKPGKSYDASFSSMNALIESCVKFSEARETALGGDDNGMNLLASVAAGEISKFDVSPLGSPGRNSPLDSPGRKSPIPEDFCSGNDVKLRHLDEDTARRGNLPVDELNDCAMAEQGNSVNCLRAKNESQHDAMPLSTNFSVDGKAISFGCEEKTGECSGQLNSSTIDLQQSTNGSYLISDGKLVKVIDSSVDFSKNATKKDKVEGEGADHLHAHIKSGAVRMRINGLSTKLRARSLFSDEDKKVDNADEKIDGSSIVIFREAASMKVEKDSNEKSHICLPLEMCMDDKSAVHRESGCVSLNEQKPPITANIHLESIGGKSEDTLLPSGSVAVVCIEMKAEKSNDMDAESQIELNEKQNIDLHPSNLDQNEESGENLEIKVVPGHCPEGATPHEEPSTIPVQQTEQCLKSSRCKLDGIETGGSGKCPSNANTSVPPRSHTVVKLDFDLNEGFPVDGGDHGTTVSVAGNSSTVHFPCPLAFPFPISSMSASYPASITVASAAKGPFVPPQNPLRSKGELGWKGSAATSAFRPAEPRKVLEMPLSTSNFPPVDSIMSKQGRCPLDFDLNVPDQRVLEDVAYQNSAEFTCLEPGPLDRHGVGFDLDLNKIDESSDFRQFSVGLSGKLDIPQLSNRSSLSGGFFKAELNASRDFDLNNGPGPDEGATDIAPHLKGSLPFLSQISAVRMNNTAELGNFSSWFPPSNSYSAVAIPSILPGRGEQSYPIVPSTGSPRILGPPTVGTSFGPEFYRGTALSSSSAVPFPPAAPYQYGAFPFETNFPMSSNLYSGGSTAYMDSSSGGPLCFSSIPPQLVVPSGVLSSHCPRSYVMNLPGGTSHVSSESRKWGGQALDLNSGPGVTDVERRDDRLSSALRQLPIPASQASVDEQIKMYQMAAGVLKRKEPDDGRDGDRISYKQPSWQ